MRKSGLIAFTLAVLIVAVGTILTLQSKLRVSDTHESKQMGKISATEYLETCKRRFGNTNPELMQVRVWEWMVKTGDNPFVARESLGLEQHYDDHGNPDWCFDRLGAARVKMPDGRIITIAGEHEDFYDPDFCIYNDIVVQKGDCVEIYGYPRSVFPPTDFHTATRVDDAIYIIGSLGYQDERRGDITPVFRLDTNDYRIERVTTTDMSPGWIHKHHAEYLPNLGVIEVTGGERMLSDGDNKLFCDNFDTYQLKIDDWTWHRITDNSNWRQFSLRYTDSNKTVDDVGWYDWYTGEVLKQLGYPCELYDDEDEDEEELRTRSHVVFVDRVQVFFTDRHGEMRMTIQGELGQGKVNEFLDQLSNLARKTNRNITKVIEL